jgi:hypothetical protein
MTTTSEKVKPAAARRRALSFLLDDVGFVVIPSEARDLASL